MRQQRHPGAELNASHAQADLAVVEVRLLAMYCQPFMLSCIACLHGDMQSREPCSSSNCMATQEAPMLRLCFVVMQSSAPYASVTNSSKKGAGVW